MAYLYDEKTMKEINNSFTPNPSQIIARYMGFEKFKKLVEDKYLWMAKAESFMDAYEGEIPPRFFINWDKENEESYKSIKECKRKVFSAYISCWFEFERESEPMWLAYGCQNDENGHRDNNGVCIISNVKKLMECTSSFDAVVHRVNYIDYEKVNKDMIVPPFFFSRGENGLFRERIFYVYKKKEYEAEKEIRAITYQNNKKMGLEVSINPNNFINNIIINPHAKNEEKAYIRDYIINAGLKDKIIDSEIICNN